MAARMHYAFRGAAVREKLELASVQRSYAVRSRPRYIRGVHVQPSLKINARAPRGAVSPSARRASVTRRSQGAREGREDAEGAECAEGSGRAVE